ncbi:MAG: SCO family protein [Bacteroidota bacterium]
MAKNRSQAVILVLVIAIPLIIYFTFRYTTSPVFNNIPYQYSLSEAGDTLFHTLPEASFTTTEGVTYSRDDMLGKVWVFSFFHSADTGRVGDSAFARILNAHLYKVYDNVSDIEMIKMVSITTDPVGDSLPVLKTYANSLGVDPTKWHFATASKADVIELGLNSFRMPDFKRKFRSGEPFTARSIALVDAEGKVRKYYDGTNLFQIEKKLSEDLRALLTLEYRDRLKKDKS